MMRKFVCKTSWFLFLIVLSTIVGLFLPTTPRASKSLLMSNIKKDSLLKYTQSPRIIFIGGSNLSFGLNSKMIKDSLHINPINTGIHAVLGLQFMMQNALQYIKKGDIVVLIPEYEHFYRDYNAGSEELLRMVFDVDISNFRLLNCSQVGNIISFMPKYSSSKFNPTEYFNLEESDVYSVNSFNQYGDAFAHWGKDRRKFIPSKNFEKEFNSVVINKVKDFKLQVEKKNALFLVSYPGYQDISFLNAIPKIKKIEKEYKMNKFVILGTPERYMIPNSMMFDTPSHLTKEGVDYRTNRFIEDFKKIQVQNKKEWVMNKIKE